MEAMGPEPTNLLTASLSGRYVTVRGLRTRPGQRHSPAIRSDPLDGPDGVGLDGGQKIGQKTRPASLKVPVWNLYATRRRISRRSASLVPPQSPMSESSARANSRHSWRTGQQTAGSRP